MAANVVNKQYAPPDEIRSAAASPLPAPTSLMSRVAVEEALRGYFVFIRTDNAARHVENKLSGLRRFLGGQRAEQFVAEDADYVIQQGMVQGPIRTILVEHLRAEIAFTFVRPLTHRELIENVTVRDVGGGCRFTPSIWTDGGSRPAAEISATSLCAISRFAKCRIISASRPDPMSVP